jgi:tetratricopeptide (TPR) repeat protein
MRPAVLAALAAAALATAIPTAARAQAPDKPAPEVSDEDRAAARRHFTRGKELHAAGRYQEAAAEYTEAYQRYPAPAFLYNVAQVYRLAGDRDAAIENYRKYLELEPDGEGSADAREFLAALEAASKAEREPGKRRKKEPTPEPAFSGGADPIDPIQVDPPRDDRQPGRNAGRGKKIAGLAFGAAGVVGLGVAVGFGIKARSAADELSDYDGPWGEAQDKTYKDGEAAERIMFVSAAIGAAALSTGAVLYYLGNRDAARASERRLQFSAAAGEGEAMLLVRGAF